MSFEAIDWVYRMVTPLPIVEFPAGPTAVLLTLANVADESGRCFATVKTMSARARCDGRTVYRHLGWLEQRGLIDWSARWVVGEDGRPHQSSELDFELHLDMDGPGVVEPEPDRRPYAGPDIDGATGLGATGNGGNGSSEAFDTDDVSPSEPMAVGNAIV